VAFPVVQTADTKNGTVTSNSNSWTLTYPTSLVSGDLIVASLGVDADPDLTLPAGFVWFGWKSLTAVTVFVGFKVSDGTETGNFTASLTSSEQGGWRVFRVTGWYGTISGLVTNGVVESDGVSLGDGNNGSTGVGTSGSTPNPKLCNPANWGTEDTLWLVVCGVDTSRTFSGFPANYTTTASDVSGGSTGASLGTAWRNNAIDQEDPGTFTISASDDWSCFTVAIRPAAAPTFGIPFKRKDGLHLPSRDDDLWSASGWQ
jgi:hypothetical protein